MIADNINRLRMGILSRISPGTRPSLARALRIIRRMAIIGGLTWAASSCGSAAPIGSSAASTHSAQTLAMLVKQMGVTTEPGLTPSLTSPTTPKITPTRTGVPSGTLSVIPTVRLTFPTAHPLRATYPGVTPTTNGTLLLTATITDRCNAAYFEGSAPPIYDGSEVKAGSTFVKTWVLRNVGTCTWYPSYFLFYYSGAHMEGPDIVDFPEIIPPNNNLLLSLTLVAPRQTGNYTGRWYLRDPEFHQFGIGPEFSDPLLVKITVVA
jgi:hypothetical protein